MFSALEEGENVGLNSKSEQNSNSFSTEANGDQLKIVLIIGKCVLCEHVFTLLEKIGNQGLPCVGGFLDLSVFVFPESLPSPTGQ